MKKLIGTAVVAAGILGSVAFMSCGSKNEMQLGKTGKPVHEGIQLIIGKQFKLHDL